MVFIEEPGNHRQTEGENCEPCGSSPIATAESKVSASKEQAAANNEEDEDQDDEGLKTPRLESARFSNYRPRPRTNDLEMHGNSLVRRGLDSNRCTELIG